MGITSVFFLVAGVFGIRGIYFALMNEAKIPYKLSGTDIGVISVVGFSPDVFMTPLMGFLLDTYPGIRGYQYIYGVLCFFSTVGLISALLLNRLSNYLNRRL